MIFQWLVTILIAMNLAVSSVPRCGMLRHVVEALLADHDHLGENYLNRSTCHDSLESSDSGESESASSRQSSSLSDIDFCPCELAKFSYIWVIFDFVSKLNANQPISAMVRPWAELLAAFATIIVTDPPPPKAI